MTELFSFLISVAAAAFLGNAAAKNYKGNRGRTITAFTVITAVVYLVIAFFYGEFEKTLKGIIFCLILLYASYEDIKIREAENYLHIMIVITAFIGCEFNKAVFMIIPALIMGLIFHIGFLVSKNFKIGGADIKLSVACAFMLGWQSFFALIIGLTAAVIINLLKRQGEKAFPLIPYLAVGFMTAYFI